MNRFEQRFRLQSKMVQELGYPLTPQTAILDFGCGGRGELVKVYRDNGYRAYGCAMRFTHKEDPDGVALRSKGVLRLIDPNSYRVPFDDNTFDVVLSDQVFEHVQDYSSALSEIKRVLKPGGISLHIFVSRYRLIEPHVLVPLASLIQRYWWFALWAHLGLKKSNQKGLSRRAVAGSNFEYLRNHTNYLTKAAIREKVYVHFDDAAFCEKTFLKCDHRGGLMHRVSTTLPFVPSLFSTFHSRVVFCRKDGEMLTGGQ